MIRHIVLVKTRPDSPERDIADIFEGLCALTDTLPGARGFTGGRSTSPERLERGYAHGFTIDFESWEALAAYAEHPEHRALGARLVQTALGGIDGLIVLDIETPP